MYSLAISRFDVPGNFLWNDWIILFLLDKSQAHNKMYSLAISGFDVPGNFTSRDSISLW